MRKLDVYEKAFLSFFLMFMIYYLNTGGTIWDSYGFSKEHIVELISFVLFIPVVATKFAKMLLYGLIVYKIELIIYNIALAIVEDPKSLNNCYDIVIALSLSIWLILVICIFYDKIALLVTKILKKLFKHVRI